jgi:hypothetical protein
MARGGSKYRKSKIKFSALKRGLILCEGETEEKYFRGLVSQEKHRRKFSSIDVGIYKPKDNSPQGLVNRVKEKIREAKREKNKFDFVWVVFDKDGHTKIPEAFENARVSNPVIKIAFTIPCFEYFILLHFEKTTKPFRKCDDVISKIKSKGHIPNYEKATNIFDILLPHMAAGLANSEWVVDRFRGDLELGEKIYNLSAYSNVHELVHFLYSLIEE